MTIQCNLFICANITGNYNFLACLISYGRYFLRIADNFNNFQFCPLCINCCVLGEHGCRSNLVAALFSVKPAQESITLFISVRHYFYLAVNSLNRADNLIFVHKGNRIFNSNLFCPFSNQSNIIINRCCKIKRLGCVFCIPTSKIKTRLGRLIRLSSGLPRFNFLVCNQAATVSIKGYGINRCTLRLNSDCGSTFNIGIAFSSCGNSGRALFYSSNNTIFINSSNCWVAAAPDYSFIKCTCAGNSSNQLHSSFIATNNQSCSNRSNCYFSYCSFLFILSPLRINSCISVKGCIFSNLITIGGSSEPAIKGIALFGRYRQSTNSSTIANCNNIVATNSTTITIKGNFYFFNFSGFNSQSCFCHTLATVLGNGNTDFSGTCGLRIGNNLCCFAIACYTNIIVIARPGKSITGHFGIRLIAVNNIFYSKRNTSFITSCNFSWIAGIKIHRINIVSLSRRLISRKHRKRHHCEHHAKN